MSERLRALPSVEGLLVALRVKYPSIPHRVLKLEATQALETCRSFLRAGADGEDPLALASRALSRILQPSFRAVINATGVVLHTNLGRAPLGELHPVAGYSNLEYDLQTGRRGKRDDHVLPSLNRLLGAQAIAVNNNAAATYLVLNELAAGREVIVSRGELIEIGDGFRIPDIMRRAGVTLIEVGTTNRTRIEDYQDAITERTALILRVHPSNFHIHGFAAKPQLKELCRLPVPVYEDLGSGCLVDLKPYGIEEPLVQESLDAGVAVVSFSGDKLLGGPQAGIIAGPAELVQRIRRNPMFRALRLDKLVTQALEEKMRALLLERYEEVPALAMLMQAAERIRDRAEKFVTRLPGLDARIIPGKSVAGGGSTPDQSLPTFLIAIPQPQMERRLRLGEPPVIARVENGELLIDLRTVFPSEEEALLGALHVSAFAR